MIYGNRSLEFGRFLHCGFRNPLAAIWAVSGWFMIFSMKILFFSAKMLRCGWVFLERTRILSGIQFTTNFIVIWVVETKRFVGTSVNVILTRQTCGQYSSRAAESKRRALGNYFSERICYAFLISKCSRDWDVGLCTTSVLAFGEPLRSGDLRKKNRVSTQEKPDFAVAQRLSKCKYRSCAQTYISVSSTFWYLERIANSLGKIIS